eukprot:2293138-Prymnesium_polylepis.1
MRSGLTRRHGFFGLCFMTEFWRSAIKRVEESNHESNDVDKQSAAGTTSDDSTAGLGLGQWGKPKRAHAREARGEIFAPTPPTAKFMRGMIEGGQMS